MGSLSAEWILFSSARLLSCSKSSRKRTWAGKKYLYPPHLDTISIGGADVCVALIATSETMEQIDLNGWPHQGRPCRLQCCRLLNCQALEEAAVQQDSKHILGYLWYLLVVDKK